MTTLKDTTFLIPVRIDSSYRIENLEIIIKYLKKYFDTNISVLESDAKPYASDFVKKNSHYTFTTSKDPVFRHSEINNRMIWRCLTPIGIIYDADVIVSPSQLETSISLIRSNKYSFAYPYDGCCMHVDYYNRRLFKEEVEIDFLTTGSSIYEINTHASVGGCFIFNIAAYKKCGLDNENIEGWGHEDAERAKRINKIGYCISRAKGPLYHLYHPRGSNSYFFDEKALAKSYEIYFKTCSLSRDALLNEISTWPWSKSI